MIPTLLPLISKAAALACLWTIFNTTSISIRLLAVPRSVDMLSRILGYFGLEIRAKHQDGQPQASQGSGSRPSLLQNEQRTSFTRERGAGSLASAAATSGNQIVVPNVNMHTSGPLSAPQLAGIPIPYPHHAPLPPGYSSIDESTLMAQKLAWWNSFAYPDYIGPSRGPWSPFLPPNTPGAQFHSLPQPPFPYSHHIPRGEPSSSSLPVLPTLHGSGQAASPHQHAPLSTPLESAQNAGATHSQAAKGQEGSSFDNLADPRWPDGDEIREVGATPETTAKNPSWRHVNWVLRSKGNTQYMGQQAEKRTCCGVILCSACKATVRPQTQKAQWEKQLRQPCPNPNCTLRQLVFVSCDVFVLLARFQRDGKTILHWKHCGTHSHPRPPGGLLSKDQQDAVLAQVARRPDASADALATGSIVPGSVPLGEVHPTLNNPRVARYHVQKAQERLGLSSNKKVVGFSMFEAVEKLEQDVGESFVVASGLVRPSFCCIQTAFMRLVLDEAINDWLQSPLDGPLASRHGFITDGDHTYFNKGILLATCVFNSRCLRWVPILHTWLLKQDTLHHQVHFKQLNASVVAAAGERFDPKMLTGVFDFSQAQRNAHAEEFAATRLHLMPGSALLAPLAKEAQLDMFRTEAMEYQKGCQVHFKTSANRVLKDLSLVPSEFAPLFNSAVETMLSMDTDLDTFNETITELRQSFPRLSGWIDWWIRDSVAPMIFPSRRIMSETLALQVPNTSNPIESQHSLLHHGSGRNHDALTGIHQLWLHVDKLRRQYEAVRGGHAPPNTRLGSDRPLRKSVVYENDGRAPDTRTALAAEDSPDILRRPMSPTSLALQWVTITHDQLFDESTGLRPYISYRFVDNSCYIDSAQELLFRAFSLWSPDSRRILIQQTLPRFSPLWSFFWNYELRIRWIASRSEAELSDNTEERSAPFTSQGRGGNGRGRGRGQGRGRGRGRGRAKGRAASSSAVPSSSSRGESNGAQGTRSKSIQPTDRVTRQKGKQAVRELSDVDPCIEHAQTILRTSQLAAQHAISNEWKLYSHGDNGSSSNWIGHSVVANTISADLATQRHFGVHYSIVGRCQFGHYTTTLISPPIIFLRLWERDIESCRLSLKLPAKAHVDIGDVLAHLTPRQPRHAAGADHNTGTKLTDLPAGLCTHPRCSEPSPLVAVQTQWPSILFIIPETASDDSDTFSARTEPPLRHALEFSIGSKSTRRQPLTSQNGGQNIPVDNVSYQLVGRQLEHRDQAHLVAEVLLSGRTYMYDNLLNSGVLVQSGKAEEITEPSNDVTFLVYHRMGDSNITEQDETHLSSLNSDRPRCTTAIVIADNDPPTLPAIHAKKSHSRPEGNIITQTLTIAAPDAFSAETSPSAQGWKTADDNISEPSKDSSSSYEANSLDSGLNLFLREIGEHPDQLGARRAGKPLRCVVCKGHSRSSSASDAGDSFIQCSKCWYTSHRACVKLHFGLPKASSDEEQTWMCPGRCNKSVPLWNDDLIGQYIFYHTRYNGRLYAAKIIDQEDQYAIIEWYAGNIYTTNEKPHKKPEANRIPIHRCAQAIADRNMSAGNYGTKLGTLRWPVRLCDEARDSYGYTNISLQSALEGAFHSIFEIVTDFPKSARHSA